MCSYSVLACEVINVMVCANDIHEMEAARKTSQARRISLFRLWLCRKQPGAYFFQYGYFQPERKMETYTQGNNSGNLLVKRNCLMMQFSVGPAHHLIFLIIRLQFNWYVGVRNLFLSGMIFLLLQKKKRKCLGNLAIGWRATRTNSRGSLWHGDTQPRTYLLRVHVVSLAEPMDSVL